jgi:hypothetical protein
MSLEITTGQDKIYGWSAQMGTRHLYTEFSPVLHLQCRQELLSSQKQRGGWVACLLYEVLINRFLDCCPRDTVIGV